MTNFIQKLGLAIKEKNQELEDFFARNFAASTALFNNSVDIRHSQFKIAPVDTNCFPAGFNNLDKDSKELAKQAVENYLKETYPTAQKILIIPENHTRNLRYFSSLKNLLEITSRNYEVKIGTLNQELSGLNKFEIENGEVIELSSITVKDNKIVTFDGFVADLIIANNDFTDGVPELIQNIIQPINPPTQMGWHMRTKSRHFEIYNDLATKVDEVLELLQKKYDQYGIKDQPYCYVKADNGTYGMAVWSVFSGKEILEINKKERNKMNMLKGSVLNTQVLIQEGVVTADKINQQISEPMIYLIGGEVVGNLFRSNESRDEKSSLNATGAHFYDLNNLNSEQLEIGGPKEEVTIVYKLIAKMAALAAAIENQQISQKNAQ